jgi:predicted dehydrogenase
MRVGLIGSGWAAGAHLGSLHRVDGVEVVAMCTQRTPAPDEFPGRDGRPIEIVRDVGELLRRPDIDAVDICSRSGDHAEQAIAAAQAGKHLIIEKPPALDLDGLRRVQAAVREAGVRTCVCLQVRFSQQFTMTRSLLEGDLIGPLHYAEVDYLHNIGPEVTQYEWNLKKGGGGSSLLTAGCHALDGLMMFMPGDVTEVTSYATGSDHPKFVRYEYPTSSVTIIRFANGAIGKVASVVDSHQPYHLRVHLVGRDGTIMDGKLFTDRVAGLDPNRWSDLGVKLESVLDDIDEPYVPQFAEFAAAVAANREMCLTSLADAARTFEVVFAADRSAELGRPVRMSEL